KKKQKKAKESKRKQKKAKQSKRKQKKAKESKRKQKKAKESKRKQKKAKESKRKQQKAKESKSNKALTPAIIQSIRNMNKDSISTALIRIHSTLKQRISSKNTKHKHTEAQEGREFIP